MGMACLFTGKRHPSADVLSWSALTAADALTAGLLRDRDAKLDRVLAPH